MAEAGGAGRCVNAHVMVAMIEKALGDDEKAMEAFKSFMQEFGKYEIEMERYYDHGLAYICLNKIIRPATQKSLIEGL